MSEQQDAMQDIARQVRIALDGGNLSSFSDLLDPDVRWGAPDAEHPSCRNRDQVLTWYRRGRESGVRASVNNVVVHGDRLLVSLTVRGSADADTRGGAALRWQVLTVSGGRIVDIVGFDDRLEALARVQAAPA